MASGFILIYIIFLKETFPRSNLVSDSRFRELLEPFEVESFVLDTPQDGIETDSDFLVTH